LRGSVVAGPLPAPQAVCDESPFLREALLS
jgi:hypothetical protein